MAAFMARCRSHLFRRVFRKSQVLEFLARCVLASSSRSGFCSSQHPISRFPVPKPASLPQDIRDAFSDLEEKTGFIPNVAKVLAHRPEEFRAFFKYYEALMLKEGNLTKAEKEMIVVATSAANNCMYCVISHGALLRIYSRNPLLGEQIATNWELADVSPRERAILKFAVKVGRSDTLNEGDFEALSQHGLSQEDAWDIGAISAFFAMSNRLAHVTDMRPNDEFFMMGRVPKDKSR
ncbi:predicted protein [Nematostella vectensis]|uniref:Carboxymuconolactone decarboxylase-like domain-containing protein n=1 Tax=Nematostella vectensis TaxID=45351 RepID=A7SVC5_NEMVE|nr:predicted protein [Nematostella vectensis]|eukprot:XP_001624436.1 predicted protein [Nematostella vectensis]